SDESRFEPDEVGGDDDHRPVVERTLLEARRQPTPLFESIDAALHHVASDVDAPVEDQWAPRSSHSLRSLVTALGNRVLDLPLTQPAPTARIAVAFVGDEAIRAGSGSPASVGAWDTDAVQDGFELRTVTAMSWGDHDRERPAAA